ncbi:MAG TPA: hypothetical protein VNX21_00825 [Candidatus Thermoplasmatota archaeon]|nr:hypothetical protein [Candidatus Thermoplasmatota archaeon]
MALLALPIAAAFSGIDDERIVSPSVLDAARALYGENLTVHRADFSEFKAAFPSLDLYAVREARAVPPRTHLMSWAPTLASGRDVTRDFNGVLADGGAVLATPDAAVRVARAYAQAANPEIQLGRDVVGAADAARLGIPVDNPVATALVDGWSVQVDTWAVDNGVWARWQVVLRLGRLDHATWNVRAVQAGPMVSDWEKPMPPAGSFVQNAYAGGHALSAYRLAADGSRQRVLLPHEVDADPRSEFMRATNFDGTVWVAYFPTRLGPVPPDTRDVARNALEAAVQVYAQQVHRSLAPCAGATNPNASWGFTAHDANCHLSIRFDDPFAIAWCGGACAYDGDPYEVDAGDDDVLISLNPRIDAFNRMSAPNVTFMRSVMGHEHFHHLQYVLEEQEDTRWTSWLGLAEGTARWSQTLASPEAEQPAGSYWYASANAYQRATWSVDLCGHGYDTALFWGDVYRRHGMGTLRDVMRAAEAHDDGASGTCANGVPRALHEALGGARGGTAKAAEALDAFALNEVHPRDFAWGAPGQPARDWGQHLDPVAPAATVAVGQDTSVRVEPFGFAVVALPTGRAYDVTCAWSATARVVVGTTVLTPACDGASPLRVDATTASSAALVASLGALNASTLVVRAR